MALLRWYGSPGEVTFVYVVAVETVYKALNVLAALYLNKLLLHYSPSCPLHSQNSGYLIIPRISKSTAKIKIKLWNNLLNIVREAITFLEFKSVKGVVDCDFTF